MLQFFYKAERVMIVNEKKLYRIEDGKRLAGVCGGLARYLNMDVTVIRLIWAILTFVGFSGIPLYIIAALIIPSESDIMGPTV